MTRYQAHFSTRASIDAEPADLLVGREKLVDTVANHIQNGRSVLLAGATGIGKTAILQAVARRTLDQVTPRQAIYCSEATTLRRTLQLLAEGLCDRQRTLPTVTTGPRVLSRSQLARLPIEAVRPSTPSLRAICVRIPPQMSQSFRSKSATRSIPNQPLVPVETSYLFRYGKPSVPRLTIVRATCSRNGHTSRSTHGLQGRFNKKCFWPGCL